MEYRAAVFIGRFQPFHRSHLDVVLKGLEIADEVVILIGSSTAARSFKNPFTYAERLDMILESLTIDQQRRVKIRGIRDYYYNMETWIASVQGVVDELYPRGSSIALLGSYKDASSYYLNSFPQWEHVPTLAGPNHSTDIRARLYESAPVSRPPVKIMADWEGKLANPPNVGWTTEVVPDAVTKALTSWVGSPEFVDAVRGYFDTEAYKASWASAPFPPTFVTTDCVVVCSGHVLVIKRKFNPGKGLYALPGGFLKQDEKIRAGALRELKEETGIRVDKIILDASIVDSQVFDHPDRSLRGRTITHAFYVKLKDGNLPEVKGNDDAAGAFWMPLWDVTAKENQFFEDHAHIVNAMIGGSK